MPLFNPFSGGSSIQNRIRMPGRFFTPGSLSTVGNVALTERYNYFTNLTINNGHAVSGIAGGTIIIVENKLQLVGTGALHCNELGGKGAASSGAGNLGLGGYGGGAFRYNAVGGLNATQGQFISQAAISATNPYIREILTPMLPSGGAGGTGGSGAGIVGSSFPAAGAGLFGSPSPAPSLTGLALLEYLLNLIVERSDDNATSGGIGGGGGGGGAGGNAAGAGGAGGTLGTQGSAGATTQGGGGGGSGFGGGGGGGGAAAIGANAAGGRGGGVLIVLCGELDNGGVISANGGAGGNAFQGCGGGGGGGVVSLGYETLSGVGIGSVLASPGAGGNSTGSGGNGGNGGSGLVNTYKIRSA